MTPMVVYDCQKCGSHSARRLHQMPWRCDKCNTDIAVGTDRDIAIVFVPEDVNQEIVNHTTAQNYVYSKEIFSVERGIEAYETIDA